MPKQRFSDTSRNYSSRSIRELRRPSGASLGLCLGLLVLAAGCSNRQELNWADYRKVSAAENNAKAPASPSAVRPFGSGMMPYGSGFMPFGSGAMPYGSGMMPYGSGGMPYGSGAMPYGSGMMPFGSGSMPYGSGAMPYGSGMMPYGSGSMPYGSGAMPYGSGMMPFGSGSMPYGSGAMSPGFAPGVSAFPFGSGAPLGSLRPAFIPPAYSTHTSTGPAVGRFPKYGTPYPTIQ